MSEAKWSPEPWRLYGGGQAAYDETERRVFVTSGPGNLRQAGKELNDTNARRIVACVNACAGIPTEALESGALGKALGLAADILAHTDPECDTENCETKHGLISALRSLGRVK